MPDEPDQVARLESFKRRHPDIAIITSTAVPTALVGREQVRRPSIGLLLDRLEEMTGDQAPGHALRAALTGISPRSRPRTLPDQRITAAYLGSRSARLAGTHSVRLIAD